MPKSYTQKSVYVEDIHIACRLQWMHKNAIERELKEKKKTRAAKKIKKQVWAKYRAMSVNGEKLQ